jgi:hypothetical protein
VLPGPIDCSALARHQVIGFQSIRSVRPSACIEGPALTFDGSSLGFSGFVCRPDCDLCDKRPDRCPAVMPKDMPTLRPW